MPRIAAADRAALVESRKAQILEATLRLLTTQSFDATSVDAIAGEAGVSKGSVYLYFDSKDAILEEIIRRYSLLSQVESLVGQMGSVPLEQSLRLVVPVLWQTLRDRRDLVKLLLREGPPRPENARLFIERVVVPTNQLVANWLTDQLGPARAKEIDPFVAGRALLGMLMVFLITQELLGGKEVRDIPDEAITNTVAEVFLNGVRGANPS